jgi:hypothetical protein
MQPLRSATLSDIVPEWDARFVEVEQEMLFELILAANYMDIKSLLDLTCAKVASMIKGAGWSCHNSNNAMRLDFLKLVQASHQRKSAELSTSRMTSRQRRRHKFGRKTGGAKSCNEPMSSKSCVFEIRERIS